MVAVQQLHERGRMQRRRICLLEVTRNLPYPCPTADATTPSTARESKQPKCVARIHGLADQDVWRFRTDQVQRRAEVHPIVSVSNTQSQRRVCQDRPRKFACRCQDVHLEDGSTDQDMCSHKVAEGIELGNLNWSCPNDNVAVRRRAFPYNIISSVVARCVHLRQSL